MVGIRARDVRKRNNRISNEVNTKHPNSEQNNQNFPLLLHLQAALVAPVPALLSVTHLASSMLR